MAPGRGPRHHDDMEPRDWPPAGTAPRRPQQADPRAQATAGRGPSPRQPRPAPLNPEAYVPQFTAYGHRPEDQQRAQPRNASHGYGQPAPDVAGYGSEPYFDPQPVPPTQQRARAAGRGAPEPMTGQHRPAAPGRNHAPDPYGEPRSHGRGAAASPQSRDQRRAAANGYDQGYGPAPGADDGYGGRQAPMGRQGYGQARQGGYEPGFDEPVAYEQPYPQPGYGAEPVDDQYADDEEDYEDDEEPPRRGRRGLIVLGALVVAVALGGGLGYVYNNAYKLTGGKSGTQPVVLKADTSPTKTAPEDPGGQAFDTAKKSIFERLGNDADGDGVADEVGADGQVLPRQEEVVARTTEGAEGAVAGLDTGDGATLPQKPKKVNTVTIKPGETITAEPSAAPESGGVEDIPGISIAESLEPAPAVPAKKKAKTEAVAAATDPEIPASEDAAASEAVAAAEQETVEVVQPVKKKKKKVAEEQVALAEPAEAAAATATTQPAASGSGYVVQVRASKSRVDALGSFADLQQKYGDLLGATQPDIQQVDLGGTKGIWYRLRLGPPGSRKAAASLCSKLKAQGLKECIVAAY